jgi:hypothetical protein
MTTMRSATCTVLLAIALGASGCLDMSYTVRLNEDGSGRVTEVVKFSAKVLRLESNLGAGAKGTTVAALLTEERVKERAKEMGPDTSVESCKIEDTLDGGKQLTAVYAFKDINSLKLCMFPLGKGWETGHLTFQYVAERSAKGRQFRLNYGYESWRKCGGPPTTGESRGRPFEPISEVELQKVRRLLPIFKDMLQGFALSVKLEIYEREQWATVTKGVHVSDWGSPLCIVNRTGGRATILEIKDTDLVGNDDALMVLVPWRQTENFADYRLQGMIGCPMPVPFYASGGGACWKAIQYADHREYY